MAIIRKRIGDVLLEAGLLNQSQLKEALQKQAESGGRLGKVLISMGILSELTLAEALSRHLRLPLIDLSQTKVPDEVMDLLPREILEIRQVVPVSAGKRSLELAMVDPLDYIAVSEIEFMTGMAVKPLIATPSAIESFIRERFPGRDNMAEALKMIRPSEKIVVLDEKSEEDEDILQLKKAGEAAPIISMVNMFLSEAVKARASDIHIEPRDKDLLVRYRIDGILRDMTTLPSYVHPSIISRLKIMSKMDIAVRRRPQDGGTKIRMGDREVDLRISTLPTLFGEKMVIRILDKSQALRTLEDLGMMPNDLDIYRSFLNRPQGMILVTGPTGSGKTTTLYASLLFVRTEGVNIITIEDPIEYQIAGVNQVRVNKKAGINFCTGLRSILRQDPNIIMVGEIRDKETAEIAFQATLTGHLVLSTLHTNNAISAITRLVDIGIEPYLVASSLVGVVAQRLVRKNCPACLAKYQPEASILEELKFDPDDKATFFRGEGCPTCHLIGYSGRTGIYEILKTGDEIRDLIINRAPEREILRKARSEGMRTMEDNGLQLVANRITTLEEISRVIPPEEISEKDRRKRVKNIKATINDKQNKAKSKKKTEKEKAY